MCLRIIDKNNDYLGFDTVISTKNKGRFNIWNLSVEIQIKANHNQRFTYTLKRAEKEDGKTA